MSARFIPSVIVGVSADTSYVRGVSAGCLLVSAGFIPRLVMGVCWVSARFIPSVIVGVSAGVSAVFIPTLVVPI